VLFWSASRGPCKPDKERKVIGNKSFEIKIFAEQVRIFLFMRKHFKGF
jgi:hypothetical protein